MAKINDKATVVAEHGIIREVFDLPGYTPLKNEDDVLWMNPTNKEIITLPNGTKLSYQGETFDGHLFKITKIQNALFSAVWMGKYFLASENTITKHIAFT